MNGIQFAFLHDNDLPAFVIGSVVALVLIALHVTKPSSGLPQKVVAYVLMVAAIVLYFAIEYDLCDIMMQDLCNSHSSHIGDVFLLLAAATAAVAPRRKLIESEDEEEAP